jgi:hypothetical protein
VEEATEEAEEGLQEPVEAVAMAADVPVVAADQQRLIEVFVQHLATTCLITEPKALLIR